MIYSPSAILGYMIFFFQMMQSSYMRTRKKVREFSIFHVIKLQIVEK